MTPWECDLRGIMAASTDLNKVHVNDLFSCLMEAATRYDRYCEQFTERFKDLADCHNLSDSSLKDIHATAWSANEYCMTRSTITESIQNRCLFLLSGNKSKKFLLDLGKVRTTFSLKDREVDYNLHTLGYRSVKQVFDIHYFANCNYGKVLLEYVTALQLDRDQSVAMDSGHVKTLISMIEVELTYLLRQSGKILDQIRRY